MFNYLQKTISAKIVYYGPALCGKTTNLQYIHQKMLPEQRGKLVSLATDEDRTLFFDFLPIELPNVKGFKTKFHVYTVPGQVFYNTTRRAVLTGVDGVVFVADSQSNRMADNIESFENLIENLKYYKKDLKNIPCVMQYNKRDLPNISSIEELNQVLNKHNFPFFWAIAKTGEGVMETLLACCKLVLKHIEASVPSKGISTHSTTEIENEEEIPPPKLPKKDSTERITIKTDTKGIPISKVEAVSSKREKIKIPFKASPGIKQKREIQTREKIILSQEVKKPTLVKEKAEKETSPSHIQIVALGNPYILNPSSFKIPITINIVGYEEDISFDMVIHLDNLQIKK